MASLPKHNRNRRMGTSVKDTGRLVGRSNDARGVNDKEFPTFPADPAPTTTSTSTALIASSATSSVSVAVASASASNSISISQSGQSASRSFTSSAADASTTGRPALAAPSTTSSASSRSTSSPSWGPSSSSTPTPSSASTSSTIASSSSSSSSSNPFANNVQYSEGTGGASPATIGIIIGGVAAFILLAIIGGCCWRRHINRRRARTGRGPRVRVGEVDLCADVEKIAEKGRRSSAEAPGTSTGGRGLLHATPAEISEIIQDSSSPTSPTPISPAPPLPRCSTLPPIHTDFLALPRPAATHPAARTGNHTAPATSVPSSATRHTAYFPPSVHSSRTSLSMWMDDSDMDVMAVDGSSYTRTLSTASSTSTLQAVPAPPPPILQRSDVSATQATSLPTPTPTLLAAREAETYMSARTAFRNARYPDADELDHPGYTYSSIPPSTRGKGSAKQRAKGDSGTGTISPPTSPTSPTSPSSPTFPWNYPSHRPRLSLSSAASPMETSIGSHGSGGGGNPFLDPRSFGSRPGAMSDGQL